MLFKLIPRVTVIVESSIDIPVTVVPVDIIKAPILINLELLVIVKPFVVAVVKVIPKALLTIIFELFSSIPVPHEVIKNIGVTKTLLLVICKHFVVAVVNVIPALVLTIIFELSINIPNTQEVIKNESVIKRPLL